MHNTPGTYIVGDEHNSSLMFDIRRVDDKYKVNIFSEKLPLTVMREYNDVPSVTLYTDSFIVNQEAVADYDSMNEIIIEINTEPFTYIYACDGAIYEFTTKQRVVEFHNIDYAYFIDSGDNCYLWEYGVIIHEWSKRSKTLNIEDPYKYIDRHCKITGPKAHKSMLFEFDDIIEYLIDGVSSVLDCFITYHIVTTMSGVRDYQLVRKSGERTKITVEVYSWLTVATRGILGVEEIIDNKLSIIFRDVVLIDEV